LRLEREATRINQRAAERGVNWWEMRLATSDHFATDPNSVRQWSFRDQVESHMALDALDEVRALYRPDTKNKGR
jgi:hypothetical protein